MTGEPCEYCGEDPCACPVFDIDPDDGGPDNPTCPDADEPDAAPDL